MASKLKLEAVQKFGGKCQCPACPVTEPDVLEFSHVNHDGGKNRELRTYRGLPASRRAFVGDKLLRHLKAAGWVDETPETGKVQMLCKNCHTLYDRGISCATQH